MDKVSVSAVCGACSGTGLYIGMAEKHGTAVVCTRCSGTGEVTVTYEPFVERAVPPKQVTTVHVARGYGLGRHPLVDGGLPIGQWSPGTIIPADEKLYCPFLYTNQKWCAHPDPKWGGAPISAGTRISECPYWGEKADCWRRYHETADAPKVTQ